MCGASKLCVCNRRVSVDIGTYHAWDTQLPATIMMLTSVLAGESLSLPEAGARWGWPWPHVCPCCRLRWCGQSQRPLEHSFQGCPCCCEAAWKQQLCSVFAEVDWAAGVS
jgi:hypothetical protein